MRRPTLQFSRCSRSPDAPPGRRVVAFTARLDHPRSLAVLPNGDVLLRFPYRPSKTRIDVAPVRVTALPAGPHNHH